MSDEDNRLDERIGRLADSLLAMDRVGAEALIREGISGTENYFRWFEDPQEQPVNRIGCGIRYP